MGSRIDIRSADSPDSTARESPDHDPSWSHEAALCACLGTGFITLATARRDAAPFLAITRRSPRAPALLLAVELGLAMVAGIETGVTVQRVRPGSAIEEIVSPVGRGAKELVPVDGVVTVTAPHSVVPAGGDGEESFLRMRAVGPCRGATSCGHESRLLEAAAARAREALYRDGFLTTPKEDVEACVRYLSECGRFVRQCRGCGGPLVGRATRWCSDACRKQAARTAQVRASWHLAANGGPDPMERP